MMETNVHQFYWREAMSTVVYTLNWVQIKGNSGKTPYELWFGHPPTVRYFIFFSSKCYIKRDEDLGKFDEEVMKEYSWDTLFKVRPTDALTRG